MKKLFVLFLLLLSMFNCSDNEPAVGTSDNANFIRGKVVSTSSETMEFKVVLLDKNLAEVAVTYTDDEGYYEFKVTNNGTYTIQIFYKEMLTTIDIKYDASIGYVTEDIIISEEMLDTTITQKDTTTKIDNPKIDTTKVDTTINTPDTVVNVDKPFVLLPTAANSEMTVQFVNSTKGAHADSTIYVTLIGRDSTDNWCYLQPNGTVVEIAGNETSENWFFKLSDIDGFQVPKKFTSARLYISVEEKLTMNGVIDINGDVGVVQPNLANPNDPNYEKIFEWVEFTVASESFWGNTTQVDQFSFPVKLSLYKDGDELVKEVGVNKTREEVFNDFANSAPEEFQNLSKYPYRIVAPCKGNFEVSSENGDYYKAYVDAIWTQYKTDTLKVNHPLGTFNGIILSNDTLEFTRVSDGEKFYINGKPNNNELFEGSGVLANGNREELALEAWVCAALNRHVMHYNNSDEWNKEENYYQEYPMNYYSKFFHDVSINKKAYGFCYDDVNDQATLIYTSKVRAIVLEILW